VKCRIYHIIFAPWTRSPFFSSNFHFKLDNFFIMINNNKPFHSSNLYEENLNRSSKKSSGRNSNVSQSFKNKKNENSFGGTLTEPSPYDDSDKIYKYRGIPSSNPLEKPNKDANKVSEFTRPTENPAYFMKE